MVTTLLWWVLDDASLGIAAVAALPVLRQYLGWALEPVQSLFKLCDETFARKALAELLVEFSGGIVAQIPFLAQKLYTGPVTDWLGGADISWIIGRGGPAPLSNAFLSSPARAR